LSASHPRCRAVVRAFAAPATANIYPKSPVIEGRTECQPIFGSSKQSVTYIPTKAGAIDVPAIDLTWWDVQSNVARHAALAAFHLQVAAGSGGIQAGATPAGTAAAATTADARGVPAAQGRTGLGPRGKSLVGAAALALLAVLVSVALYRRRGRSSTATTGAAVQPPLQRKAALIRALRNACEADVAHSAAQALLDLAKLEWPDDPPRGLGTLAARIQSGRAEVLELDRHLYGGGSPRWSGVSLHQAVRNGLRPTQSPDPAKSTGLKPLYPATASH
jgi:hypothetical protein